MLWKLMFLIYIIGCFVILFLLEFYGDRNLSVWRVLRLVMLWPLMVVAVVYLIIFGKHDKEI